jgi:hypothetical protein
MCQSACPVFADVAGKFVGPLGLLWLAQVSLDPKKKAVAPAARSIGIGHVYKVRYLLGRLPVCREYSGPSAGYVGKLWPFFDIKCRYERKREGSLKKGGKQ